MISIIMSSIDNQKKSNSTVNYTDVDISKIHFTKLEENDRSKGQKISYPKYDHPIFGGDHTLDIQFPWLTLSTYGIPRVGEFYKEDWQRLFIKIPLDETNQENIPFINFIKSVDELLSSSTFKQNMFGSKADKYKYQSIFRLPQEEDDDDDDDDDDKKKKKKKSDIIKHPYMKVKLHTSYPDNKILTRVFNSIKENPEKSKRTRTPITDISSVDELNKYICWMSKIHPICRPIKLWAQSLSKTKDPSYGLTFKVIMVEVEPPLNMKKNINTGEFINSDDDDEDDDSDNKITIKTTNNKESNNKESNNKEPYEDEDEDEDDEEDDDESSDESDIEVNQKKITPKAKSKK
jgi:hypothetical protein